MTVHQNVIFRTLDNQPRILFWKLDEFLLMAIPFLLAICLGNFLFVIGSLIKIPYAKLKKKLAHRSIQHYAYWYMPTSMIQKLGHFKNLPQSHIREFLL